MSTYYDQSIKFHQEEEEQLLQQQGYGNHLPVYVNEPLPVEKNSKKSSKCLVATILCIAAALLIGGAVAVGLLCCNKDSDSKAAAKKAADSKAAAANAKKSLENGATYRDGTGENGIYFTREVEAKILEAMEKNEKLKKIYRREKVKKALECTEFVEELNKQGIQVPTKPTDMLAQRASSVDFLAMNGADAPGVTVADDATVDDILGRVEKKSDDNNKLPQLLPPSHVGQLMLVPEFRQEEKELFAEIEKLGKATVVHRATNVKGVLLRFMSTFNEFSEFAEDVPEGLIEDIKSLQNQEFSDKERGEGGSVYLVKRFYNSVEGIFTKFKVGKIFRAFADFTADVLSVMDSVPAVKAVLDAKYEAEIAELRQSNYNLPIFLQLASKKMSDVGSVQELMTAVTGSKADIATQFVEAAFDVDVLEAFIFKQVFATYTTIMKTPSMKEITEKVLGYLRTNPNVLDVFKKIVIKRVTTEDNNAPLTEEEITKVEKVVKQLIDDAVNKEVVEQALKYVDEIPPQIMEKMPPPATKSSVKKALETLLKYPKALDIGKKFLKNNITISKEGEFSAGDMTEADLKELVDAFGGAAEFQAIMQEIGGGGSSPHDGSSAFKTPEGSYHMKTSWKDGNGSHDEVETKRPGYYHKSSKTTKSSTDFSGFKSDFNMGSSGLETDFNKKFSSEFSTAFSGF